MFQDIFESSNPILGFVCFDVLYDVLVGYYFFKFVVDETLEFDHVRMVLISISMFVNLFHDLSSSTGTVIHWWYEECSCDHIFWVEVFSTVVPVLILSMVKSNIPCDIRTSYGLSDGGT